MKFHIFDERYIALTQLIFVLFFSQAKLLSSIAELYWSFTKVGNWWLGLTDLGELTLISPMKWKYSMSNPAKIFISTVIARGTQQTLTICFDTNHLFLQSIKNINFDTKIFFSTLKTQN
jgi:hypothetical protein